MQELTRVNKSLMRVTSSLEKSNEITDGKASGTTPSGVRLSVEEEKTDAEAVALKAVVLKLFAVVEQIEEVSWDRDNIVLNRTLGILSQRLRELLGREHSLVEIDNPCMGIGAFLYSRYDGLRDSQYAHVHTLAFVTNATKEFLGYYYHLMRLFAIIDDKSVTSQTLSQGWKEICELCATSKALSNLIAGEIEDVSHDQELSKFVKSIEKFIAKMRTPQSSGGLPYTPMHKCQQGIAAKIAALAKNNAVTTDKDKSSDNAP